MIQDRRRQYLQSATAEKDNQDKGRKNFLHRIHDLSLRIPEPLKTDSTCLI
jgi:hypothetical protein